MLEFDPERVLANVRQADTEDLLDRATVYRAGMEPRALEMIEAELLSRGVTDEQIRAHAERRLARSISLPDGTAAPCSFCDRPAVTQGWGWHRLWGLLPVFPMLYNYCERHQPAGEE
jgi:hypothetical protein